MFDPGRSILILYTDNSEYGHSLFGTLTMSVIGVPIPKTISNYIFWETSFEILQLVKNKTAQIIVDSYV